MAPSIARRPDAATPTGTPWRLLWLWGVPAVIWSIAALIATSQQWAQLAETGKQLSWFAAFIWQAPGWLLLIGVTPLLAWCVVRWPISPERPRRIVGHAIAAIAFAALFAAVSVPLRFLFHPSPVRWSIFGDAFYKSIPQLLAFGLVLYAIVVGVVSLLDARRRLAALVTVIPAGIDTGVRTDAPRSPSPIAPANRTPQPSDGPALAGPGGLAMAGDQADPESAPELDVEPGPEADPGPEPDAAAKADAVAPHTAAPANDPGPAATAVLHLESAAGHVRLRPAEILWIESTPLGARLHATDGTTHLLRDTVASLETQLRPLGVVRTHRSVLVQVAHIREITGGASRDGTIRLTTGHALPVARRRRPMLAAALAPEADDAARARDRGADFAAPTRSPAPPEP